jgi:CBS domain-containing protein
MKVKDVMSSPAITEDEDVSVAIISRDMELSGVGSVVITENGKPAGIITDRDIATKVIMRDRIPGEVKAKEVMSSPLITIKPDAPVEETCRLLAKHDIRRLPVMDNGTLVGIISVRNILRRAPEQLHKFYPAETEERVSVEILEVGDVMTRRVVTEDEEASVAKISAEIAEWDIGSVVITKDGKPTGIVTDRDIALKGIMRETREIKAKEIMSSPLMTIEPGALLEKACKILAANHIRRLPVMDNGELVGIISVRNILIRAPGYVKKFYPEE